MRRKLIIPFCREKSILRVKRRLARVSLTAFQRYRFYKCCAEGRCRFSAKSTTNTVTQALKVIGSCPEEFDLGYELHVRAPEGAHEYRRSDHDGIGRGISRQLLSIRSSVNICVSCSYAVESALFTRKQQSWSRSEAPIESRLRLVSDIGNLSQWTWTSPTSLPKRQSLIFWTARPPASIN